MKATFKNQGLWRFKSPILQKRSEKVWLSSISALTALNPQVLFS